MNKLVKSLTVAALTVSASVYAHTEHTYLQTRPQGVNLPMEYSTFNERMTSKLEDRFGGNFMVTGFYTYSADKNAIGEYFGIAGKHKFVLGQLSDVQNKKADFDIARVIHAETTGNATVEFNPKESTYGVRFDYYQNLDKVVKGLYLKINLPIVNVERDMEMEVSSETAGLKDTVVNYFKGTGVAQTGSVTKARAGLTKGLINGAKSETGVADIDITLGYKVLYNEKYHVGLNLAVTIPTGNDASVDRLFEPIYGNGGHFALGGGLDAQARVWGDREHNIKLNFVANYRYLFEASENRLPRIKDASFAYVNLANTKDPFVIPAPNKLTLNCDVTPGSMFDGIVGLAYNKGCFSADLGYNLYFRQGDDVNVKGKVEEGLYVVKNTSWDTHGTFDVTADGIALTNDSLNMDSASTQSQFTNGVYGALGYTYKEWEYPLMLGIGGKYDFAAKNSAIEQWQVWGKASLSF